MKTATETMQANDAVRHANEQACRAAYDDFYHKVRALVDYDHWCGIWNFIGKRFPVAPTISIDASQVSPELMAELRKAVSVPGAFLETNQGRGMTQKESDILLALITAKNALAEAHPRLSPHLTEQDQAAIRRYYEARRNVTIALNHICCPFPAQADAAPAAQAQPGDNEIMEKVQEFASTWAIAGGPFDDGTAVERAEACKEEIRALLSRSGASQPAAPVSAEPVGYGVFWREKGQDCSMLKSLEDDALKAAVSLGIPGASVEPVFRGAAPVAAQAPGVDMVPPATSRDRWMYQQGRLAERDPRTPGSLAAEIAAQPQQESQNGPHTPPFSNCSFRLCDLPGQCRGEGKCHHPAMIPVPAQAQQPVSGADGVPEEPEYLLAWRRFAALYGHDMQPAFTAGWNAAAEDLLQHCVESALHIAKDKPSQPKPSSLDSGRAALAQQDADKASTQAVEYDIEAAAKTIAKRMYCSWEHMPEKDRSEMRLHARAVIDAARKEQA